MFFFAALLYHAWIGMRDIVMDYVKPTAIRLGLETRSGACCRLPDLGGIHPVGS
jgi:succinate dehydrogenase hydrophobic membrane anchor protein